MIGYYENPDPPDTWHDKNVPCAMCYEVYEASELSDDNLCEECQKYSDCCGALIKNDLCMECKEHV